MRVAVVPGDETGCGTYRMILPANAVQRVRPDWEIEIYQPGTVKVGTEHGRLTSVKGLDPRGLDVLVMQRVGSSAPMQFTDWAREHGIATVLDADDAMWCIDKDNWAYKAWNNASMNWRILDTAMHRADLVTVTTDYLARRYGKHGRCEVIDNTVPSEVLDLPSLRDEHDERVAVGWAGFVGTHPQDLQVVGEAVRRYAERSGGGCVRVVGDATGAAKAWGLTEVEEVSAQPLGPAYFQALSKIDIALVPLADSGFNRGKSWLKALEFSAMGVPVIASPTPDNLALARHLPIEIARTPEEWYRKIAWLGEHPDEREDRGLQARLLVGEKFTTDCVGERWAAAWERAFARRQRMGGYVRR